MNVEDLISVCVLSSSYSDTLGDTSQPVSGDSRPPGVLASSLAYQSIPTIVCTEKPLLGTDPLSFRC